MEIKEARKNARYSQRAAAEELGISIPTYRKLEENPDVMSMGMARRVADLYGVPVRELFFFESDDN